MARNVIKRDQATGEAVAKPDKAPLQGGTPGMPSDPNPASHLIHGIDDIAPAREYEARADEKVARRFRVTGGPDSVMYDGNRVRVFPGNIYSDAATDIDLLKRQGVQLEEVR